IMGKGFTLFRHVCASDALDRKLLHIGGPIRKQFRRIMLIHVMYIHIMLIPVVLIRRDRASPCPKRCRRAIVAHNIGMWLCIWNRGCRDSAESRSSPNMWCNGRTVVARSIGVLPRV